MWHDGRSYHGVRRLSGVTWPLPCVARRPWCGESGPFVARRSRIFRPTLLRLSSFRKTARPHSHKYAERRLGPSSLRLSARTVLGLPMMRPDGQRDQSPTDQYRGDRGDLPIPCAVRSGVRVDSPRPTAHRIQAKSSPGSQEYNSLQRRASRRTHCSTGADHCASRRPRRDYHSPTGSHQTVESFLDSRSVSGVRFSLHAYRDFDQPFSVTQEAP